MTRPAWSRPRKGSLPGSANPPASPRYVTASAEEKQAETQVQQTQLQLSYTKIFSPFDGRVTKKSIEPGNYVQPGWAGESVEPRVDVHDSSLEQSHRAAPLPPAILGTAEGP